MKARTLIFKKYILLYVALLIYSFAPVCAKYAAIQDGIVYTSIWFAFEFILLVVYALIWQQVLKRFELSVAMSNKGVTVLFVMVWSALIFRESISVYNIIGSIIIMIGIGLVAVNG